MIALLKKELRQLLPYVYLWLGLVLLFYGTELLTLRIDESSFESWCGQYCDNGHISEVVLFTIIFNLIVSYGVFSKEFDDETIDFLRSLPVHPLTVFVSKVFAVWGLLVFLFSIEYVLDLVLLGSNQQTISGKHYSQIDNAFFIRECLFAFVIVSHGVFLSWFRTVGLVIYCVYFITLMWLEAAVGNVGNISIFNFYNNEYHGQSLLLDSEAIRFHVITAIVLLFFSYFLWTRTESRPKAKSQTKSGKLWSFLFSGLAFAFVMVLMFSFTQMAALNDDKDLNIAEISPYRFVYHSANQSDLNALFSVAQSDYNELSVLLDATELQPIVVSENNDFKPPSINVDMTSENEHALGLAAGKNISMRPTSEQQSDTLTRRVLSHETAHVFQSVESGYQLAEFGNSVGFFIEGMAQYTSFSIVPDELTRGSNWLISSVAWKRQGITFAELADRQYFDNNYDSELLYGIGDIWVASMAEVCGEDSIGQFLRWLKTDKPSTVLGGEAFWRYALQALDCELGLVNSHWKGVMQHMVDQPREAVFPDVEHVVINSDEADNALVLSATVIAETGKGYPKQFFLRIQNKQSLNQSVSPTVVGQVHENDGSAKVIFNIHSSLLQGNTFRYQIGYTPQPDSRRYFDEWRNGHKP